MLRTQVSVSELDQEEVIGDQVENTNTNQDKTEEEATANAEEGEGEEAVAEVAEPKPKKAHKDLKEYTTAKFGEMEPMMNEKIEEIEERLYKMKGA